MSITPGGQPGADDRPTIPGALKGRDRTSAAPLGLRDRFCCAYRTPPVYTGGYRYYALSGRKSKNLRESVQICLIRVKKFLKLC